MEENLVEMTLNDIVITVDSETAEILLTDEDAAHQYYEKVKHAMVKDLGSDKDSNETIWKHIKSNGRDIEATHEFLRLRHKYDDKFKDKKTCKNTVWMLIATQMNDKTFYVGDGIEGREKCRHKFANLQSAYLKFIDKRRQTGEGKIKPPPFFDELDLILGDKHKTEPELIIDSIPNKESTKEHEESNKENLTNEIDAVTVAEERHPSSPSTSGNSTSPRRSHNKFKNIKSSVRPSKNHLLEQFYDLSKSNAEKREKEFDRIMTFMEKQADQRYNQVMAMLQNRRKNKKRKRSSSSESD